ncbi:MAG: hypothetical protein U9R50_00160 [Campylobacterota bacterium]|nr:hypothetical protein [Campylobacterota bacterium]
MKTILYILTPLFIIQLNATSDLKWVDKQVDAIKPSRSGIDTSYINNLQSPIRLAKPKETKTKDLDSPVVTTSKTARKLHLKPLILETIINKSAYINGKWYTINDRVRGKKITLIDKDYVVLEVKKKKTRLFVNRKNDKIKITTR